MINGMKSWLRAAATIIILLATAGFFVYYFSNNESVRQQLSQTSPAVVAMLLVLYVFTVVALAMIFHATLRLCKLKLGRGETALLTAYSSVINFFGPLQSGPAFRAVYLKARHNLNLKNYASATLVYYFIYGVFSCLLLVSGLLGWWLIPIMAVGVGCLLLLRRAGPVAARLQNLDLRNWYYLAIATAIQIVLVVAIYYVELHNLNPEISMGQTLVYTGAANLALFVSLTPGAIGFRESFLVFSQQLHDISTPTIVAANILDRAMYISLMLILAIFIFGSHAHRQLTVNRK